MSGSCRVSLMDVREALPVVRELSGVPPGRSGGQLGVLGIVGTPSRMSLRGGRLFWMSGSCQEALPVVREWSGSPLECPVVVGRPSWMSGSCRVSLLDVREALPVVREWPVGPPKCPKVVGRPSRMSRNGWEALSDVR